MSEMPCTPWRRMSSAMRNASKKLVPRSTVSIRRSASDAYALPTDSPLNQRITTSAESSGASIRFVCPEPSTM